MKIKALFSVILVALAAFAVPTTTHAEEDILAITSVDNLVTYVVDESRWVSGSVGTTLPVSGNLYDAVMVESPTVAGISNTIRGLKLSIDIVNPQDPLYSWADVHNDDGDLLLYGNNSFKLEPDKAGYELPKGYGNFELVLNDLIPLRIKGAQYSYVSIRDKNGEVITQAPLQVEDEKVYFPWRLAGTNGIVSVNKEFENPDGSLSGRWTHWDISSGTYLKPDTFRLRYKTSIQGIIPAKDSDVLVNVPTKNRVGRNVNVNLVVTHRQWVLVSSWTDEHWSTGAAIRMAQSKEVQYYQAVAMKDIGYMGFYVLLEPGDYYITPTWTPGHLIQPMEPWYPDYGYDSGKGN